MKGASYFNIVVFQDKQMYIHGGELEILTYYFPEKN